MDTNDHYLKKELYDFIRNDSSLFDFLHENSLDGIWYWDLEHPENEWMSPRFWTLLGYRPEEKKHLASEWQDLIDPKDLQTALDNFNKHCADPQHPYDQVVRYRHKDGSTVWVRCRGMAIRNEKGKPIRMLGAHIELTQQKRAEEQVIRERDLARRYLDTAESIIIALDAEGRISLINPKGCRLLGYQESELIGQHWFSQHLPQPEGMERVFPHFLKLIQGKVEAAEFFVNPIVTRSGETRLIAWHNSLLRSESGAITGTLSTGEDITSQKRAQEAMGESESKFRSLVEQAAEMLFLHDLGGRLIDVNKAAIKNTGYSREELQQMTVFDIDPEASDRDDRLNYWQSLEIGAPPVTFEVRHRRKNGSIYPAEVVASKVVLHNEQFILGLARDITERKQAEELRRQSMQRHRSILKTAMDGFWLVSQAGKLLEVNDAYCRMSGYSEEELLTMSIADLEAREDMQEVDLHSKKILKKGRDRFETVHRRKDKSCFDVEVSVQYADVDNGQFIAFLRDITERKQAEKALRESEERYRSIFMNSPVGLFRSTFDGQFLEVNPSLASTLGYASPQDVLDNISNIAEQIYVKSEKRDEIISSQRHSHDVSHYLNRYRRKDGSEFIANLYLKTVRDHDNRPLFLQGFVEDITEKKKAENALRENEEKYRKLVTMVPFGIQLSDAEGRIIFSNPAHHRIHGFAEGELLGKFIWDLTSDDAQRQMTKDYYYRIFREKPEPEAYYTSDRTKDGRIIDVQINWDYIYDSENKIEGIISIVKDITLQKSLEKKLQHAQKMESIGNLAGGIAHDFNNLLFPIIGISEMLLEDLPPSSPQRDGVLQINKSGKRASDLVKQILAFSRQSEQKKIPTKIQQVLKEAIKLSRSTIPANITITQDIQSDCSLVMADPSQIHQIVMNLITNAYHALEEKNGTITVRLEEVAVDEEHLQIGDGLPKGLAKLTVCDDGVGIAPDLLNKIFEPYFTTKEQGKGTGLGLAVVYGIVKDHHGEIKVNSEPGLGTCFTVSLPTMANTEPSTRDEVKDEPPRGHEHILLVDDEKAIARLEKEILERLGYRVTMCLDSREALRTFMANPQKFDLIITDMTMPELTGDQLAAAVKAIHPDLPVIICTGYSERLDRVKASEIGVKGFLMKPIVTSDLANTVRTLLDQSRQK